jgi:hypothetical protein
MDAHGPTHAHTRTAAQQQHDNAHGPTPAHTQHRSSTLAHTGRHPRSLAAPAPPPSPPPLKVPSDLSSRRRARTRWPRKARWMCLAAATSTSKCAAASLSNARGGAVGGGGGGAALQSASDRTKQPHGARAGASGGRGRRQRGARGRKRGTWDSTLRFRAPVAEGRPAALTRAAPAARTRTRPARGRNPSGTQFRAPDPCRPKCWPHASSPAVPRWHAASAPLR